MVKIRLKRMGAKKRPFYRLVVADSRSPRDGRFIELLGWYDPLTEPVKVQIDADKVQEWMRKGARPSDSARALLVQQGILAKQARVWKEAPAKEVAPAATAEAPAAAEAVTEEAAAETPQAETAAEAADEPTDAATDEAAGEESEA